MSESRGNYIVATIPPYTGQLNGDRIPEVAPVFAVDWMAFLEMQLRNAQTEVNHLRKALGKSPPKCKHCGMELE